MYISGRETTVTYMSELLFLCGGSTTDLRLGAEVGSFGILCGTCE